MKRSFRGSGTHRRKKSEAGPFRCRGINRFRRSACSPGRMCRLDCNHLAEHKIHGRQHRGDIPADVARRLVQTYRRILVATSISLVPSTSGGIDEQRQDRDPLHRHRAYRRDQSPAASSRVVTRSRTAIFTAMAVVSSRWGSTVRTQPSPHVRDMHHISRSLVTVFIVRATFRHELRPLTLQAATVPSGVNRHARRGSVHHRIFRTK
uniref:Uncharacterized protein n=1 Tax=Rhodococcus sp. NS1 TaxID=402236 RepID=A0A097SQ63_9NOCA|nr:hypothetical protein LRS1606.228 [Rhodococcus sp. NS1]